MPSCPSFPFIRASLFHLYPFYIKQFPAYQKCQDISNMSSNAYPFLALLNTQIWENCIFGWGMGQALSNMSFIADPFMAFLPPKYAKTAYFGGGKGQTLSNMSSIDNPFMALPTTKICKNSIFWWWEGPKRTSYYEIEESLLL